MGAHNLSFSHTPADITRTLEAYREVFQILRDAIGGRMEALLEVDVVEPVFRKA